MRTRLAGIKIIVLLILMIGTFCFTFGQDQPKGAYPQLLFPEFIRGDVFMKSGKLSNAMLNYNTVDEEMLVSQDGVFRIIANPEAIDTIVIQSRKFVFMNGVFYELILSNKISFYYQNKNRFAPVASNTAYGMKSQTQGPTNVSTVRGGGSQFRVLEMPDNVEISNACVNWVMYKGEMQKFTTERQLMKIFPEIENDLKDFLKKNKVGIRKKEDVHQIALFINQKIG
ncbi:MAG: hypothetical protein WCI31_09850 [Prolixibacteraceae bacterium]